MRERSPSLPVSASQPEPDREAGWQIVTPRRTGRRGSRSSPPPAPSARRPVMVDLVGRCFNCLRPNHVAAVYPNIVCCLHCHGEGHQACFCKRSRWPNAACLPKRRLRSTVVVVNLRMGDSSPGGEPWPSLLRAGGGASWSSEFGGAARRWRKVVPTTTSRPKMAVGSTVPCSETLPAPHCVDSMPETDAGIRPTVSSRATVSSCSSRAADHPSDGLLLDSHPVVGERRSRCCCKSRSRVPGSTLPQQGGGTQEFEFLHSYATRHIDSYQPRGLDWDPMLVESSLPSPRWALSDVAMQSPLDTAV
jgi:hypothetical protein